MNEIIVDLSDLHDGILGGIADTWRGAADVQRPADASTFHEPHGNLGAAIRSYYRGNTLGPDSATVAEARHLLRRLTVLCEPADDGLILNWLAQMAQGVRNAPANPAEAAARSGPLVETCRRFPAAVWSDEVRLAYWKTSPFWPLPADLFKFLEPYAIAVRRQMAGCEAVIVQRNEAQDEAAGPDAGLSVAERKRIGAEFKARALAAIAEGASLLNIPSAAAARRPIVRTRTDDLAHLTMLKARAASTASSEPVRRACAQTAHELEARLMGEGVSA
jgi:hypothetical protein